MPTENVIMMVPENPVEDGLKGRVSGFLEGGYTQTQAAREAGISASALSQWLKGAYEGDNAAVEAKLAAWVDGQDTRRELELPEPPVWVDTPTGQRVLMALVYARMMQAIGPVYGAAGVGKTYAAERYVATHPNTWMATMSPDTGSIAAAMEEIAIAVGLREMTGRAARVRREIVRKIKGTSGLLIIDEAQHLTMPALESIRRIFDGAGIGLALLGNDTVFARLTGGTRGADFARLFSRIGNRVNLRAVATGDAKAVAGAWGITDRGQVRVLEKIAGTPGGLRAMTYTLQLASMAAAGAKKPLAVTHIRGAWKTLGVGSGE